MTVKLERFFFGLILAPLTPLAGLMAGWWASYSLLPENWIPLGTIAGCLLGMAADIFLLKGLIERARRLTTIFWAAVFLFYTVGMFGFFMGVPVFNALLGIPAGFVVAAKLAEKPQDVGGIGQAATRTAWFTTGVLFLVCAASAWIALVSSSTPADLKGMLGLGFEVTQGMIVGLIVAGGLGLLAVNWLLTLAALKVSYRVLMWKVEAAG